MHSVDCHLGSFRCTWWLCLASACRICQQLSSTQTMQKLAATIGLSRRFLGLGKVNKGGGGEGCVLDEVVQLHLSISTMRFCLHRDLDLG